MFTWATADNRCELYLYTVKHLFTRMMVWHAKCSLMPRQTTGVSYVYTLSNIFSLEWCPGTQNVHFRFPSVASSSSQVSPLQHRHISALREPETRLRVRAILKWLSKTQNRSNRVITFDRDLKTTLIPLNNIFVYSNLLKRRNYKNV